MAQRRMFSVEIVSSDAFLDMPLSSQVLYFHLGMSADDDGFIGNPKKISRMLGSTDDDVKILIAKRFVLVFENGVIVIKHWLQHNLIRADLYKETNYKNEKKLLGLNENGSYTELREGVLEIKEIVAPKWLKRRQGKTVQKRTAIGTQSAHRIGKVRIGKVSKVKVSIEREKPHHSLIGILDNSEFLDELSINFPNHDIKEEVEKMKDWCAANGKTKKDYKAFARNWLRKADPKVNRNGGVLIIR